MFWRECGDPVYNTVSVDGWDGLARRGLHMELAMKKLRWILHTKPAAALLLAALVIALVTMPLAGTVPETRAQGTLVIGYLGAADTDTANGARLAVEQINSIGGVTLPDGATHLLELVTLDTAPTVDNLFDNVTALGVLNAVALLGPDNASTLVGNNLDGITARGVPVLTGATEIDLTNTDTTDVIIRLRASEDYYSAALASYLTTDLGLSSLSVVQTGANFNSAVGAFEAALATAGIVPAPQVVLSDGSTLGAQIPALVAANPEAIALWGTDQDAVTLLRKLRAAGWQGIFAYGRADEIGRSGLLPADVMAGVIGTTSWSYAYTDLGSRNFLNDYIVAFGQLPGPLAAASYDAVWMLRETLGQAGIKPADLRAAILAFGPKSIVGGALNPVAYANGDLNHTVMVYRLGTYGGVEVVALFDNGARQNLVDAGA